VARQHYAPQKHRSAQPRRNMGSGMPMISTA
jgi:hypothetical protein